ncbi:uncharacterized protein F4812DRAFT_463423 [Daldinia caldariorum]|uniref:uncharacterized protein n=1 Tax=Daldinia caldariorum TaxID=326644 RepID=UPI002007DB5A|nr:uncharacterized protein F4812DRAFT_463423 [Daldinia caldariorum]KAI1463597.1 hypothetical protein F4812DRAFT_463423 [Daldinia caldariorum]
MVSFFGFKLGGEKKKVEDASPTQVRRKLVREPLDEEFPMREAGKPAAYSVNVSSGARPNTSHSVKVTAMQTRPSPYGADITDGAATSMSDLPQPSFPVLKQHSSNPTLGSAGSWHNASSPSDIAPPVPMRHPSRPATPVQQQQTVWANPLEMHSAKGSAASLASAPLPLLSKQQLKLEIPNEPAPGFREEDSSIPPSPLRVGRPSPGPNFVESPQTQSPSKPPSPPQSIRSGTPVLGRPTFPRDDMLRSSSRGSHRNIPTTLKEVQNIRDMSNHSRFGPAAIPSPIATPRGSEDRVRGGLANILGDPSIHIRTVSARRDNVNPRSNPMLSERRSLEMRVEELTRPCIEEPIQRPRTSNGSEMGKLMRPPPLNLSSRPRTPDRAGTYPPPFAANQKPQSPMQSPRRMPRDRSGPPPAAVGARRPNTRNVRRPTADEYEIQPSSQPPSQPPSQPQSRSQSRVRRMSQDSISSSYFDRPPSPDSPLMPRTGPLAGSPSITPIEAPLAPPPPPKNLDSRSRLQEMELFLADGDEEEAEQDDEPLIPPRLSNRNVPTPDSTMWPMPSPTASSFDDYSSRVGSPLGSPPRVMAGGNVMVGPRSESPFGMRSFNFSRPMTPTLAHAAMRHDFNHHNHYGGGYGGYNGVVMPPKRSETAPLSPGFRDPQASPSMTRPLPPRSNTASPGMGYGHGHGQGQGHGRGLRSPAIVGDDFGGGGFI